MALSVLSVLGCRKMYENVAEVGFDVTVSKTTVEVGKTVTFNITGNPDLITFWSGEKGHDYAYRETERIYTSQMSFSFSTTTKSGTTDFPNPSVVPIAWSSDFTGEYTEDAVKAATWNDITDMFTLPDKSGITKMPSGSVQISPFYSGLSTSEPIYFRYHFKYSSEEQAKGNGRTQWTFDSVSFTGMTDGVSEEIYDLADAGWQIVETESCADQTRKSSVENGKIAFDCGFSAPHDVECWAVSGAIYNEGAINLGVDYGLGIKAIADAELTSYSYIYDKPGDYTVTFVGANANAYDRKEVVKVINIKVVEKGEILDPEDPYTAEIPVLGCKVGEPLEIMFSGYARAINLWTGEVGHDYEFATTERYADLLSADINFKMLLGGSGATQRHPVKIKYSTDFAGDVTEENIAKATWTDVSDQFKIPTYIHGTDFIAGTTEKSAVPGKTSPEPADVGTVDCRNWFTGTESSCRIAFFYHVEKNDPDYVDEATGQTAKGRTFFYLYDMLVKAQYDNEEAPTSLYQHKKTDVDATSPILVKGSSFDSKDSESNTFSTFNGGEDGYIYANPCVLRMGAAFKPGVDKESWLVLPELKLPARKNYGVDTPVVIKATADDMPESYSYTFAKAGTYDIVIVASLAENTEDVKRVTVTVNE